MHRACPGVGAERESQPRHALLTALGQRRDPRAPRPRPASLMTLISLTLPYLPIAPRIRHGVCVPASLARSARELQTQRQTGILLGALLDESSAAAAPGLRWAGWDDAPRAPLRDTPSPIPEPQFAQNCNKSFYLSTFCSSRYGFGICCRIPGDSLPWAKRCELAPRNHCFLKASLSSLSAAPRPSSAIWASYETGRCQSAVTGCDKHAALPRGRGQGCSSPRAK